MVNIYVFFLLFRLISVLAVIILLRTVRISA